MGEPAMKGHRPVNHAKHLRHALTLSALGIPFILFSVAYMAFIIPGDHAQTVAESFVAFTPLAAGLLLFAAGWTSWLLAIAADFTKRACGGVRNGVRKLLRKIQLKRHPKTSKDEGRSS